MSQKGRNIRRESGMRARADIQNRGQYRLKARPMTALSERHYALYLIVNVPHE